MISYLREFFYKERLIFDTNSNLLHKNDISIMIENRYDSVSFHIKYLKT